MHDVEENRCPVHFNLDVLGGIAGHKFIASVLDARPDLAAASTWLNSLA